MESGIRNPETEIELRKRKRKHNSGKGNGILTAKGKKKNKTASVCKYPASRVALIFPDLSGKIEGDSVRKVVYRRNIPSEGEFLPTLASVSLRAAIFNLVPNEIFLILPTLLSYLFRLQYTSLRLVKEKSTEF